MALQPGTKLGPYQIVAPIGAGGMGEVYRATDTRLDRTVAVKVLPAHVAANPEARQRFEREARAVSALNHPHICALYDVGSQDGVDFLVMEHLEGETMSARLAHGPLAADELLSRAIEIADALAQAHRKDVYHRDLKPGNVMLTKSGAKLLDFGLAKVGVVRGTVDGGSQAPTVAAELTQKGTLLGTVQYMSPEQLQGRDADARSDIFSFGAVLYEMATGRKAFAVSTPADVIGAILHAQPPPLESPALERVVRACLAKDPDERWQSAQDLKRQLQWMGEQGAGAEGIRGRGPGVGAAMQRRWNQAAGWAVAAVLLVIAVAVSVVHFREEPPAPERPVRFSIAPPEKATFGSGPVISPDGTRVAFVASVEGKSLLWIRALDSLASRPLAGTDGAEFSFWSPGSRFVGFFAQGKLKKIDVSGGPPQSLCDVRIPRGGTWNREGVIVFAPHVTEGLYRVSSAGGEPSPLTTLDTPRQENSHRFPHFLPDGRHFLYFGRSSQRENSGIFVGSLDSKTATQLVKVNSDGAYAPPRDGRLGHLLFVREGTLLAQPFDAGKKALTGEAFPVAEPVGPMSPTAPAAFSVSESGLLAYTSGVGGNMRLFWRQRDGKRLDAVGEPGVVFRPELSPNDQRLAAFVLNAQSGIMDIWLFELSRGVRSRLTFGRANAWHPVWSPDGSRVVFGFFPKGRFDIYQKPASGAGSEELLLESNNSKFPADWSPDGGSLLYEDGDPNTDLWVLPMTGDRKPVPFLKTPFNETQGQFSPDGRWVAYTSDENGKYQVYVQPFRQQGGAAGKWQVSTAGGSQPRWRRDGKELFYVAEDRKLMAVPVTGTATFETGSPKPLFDFCPVGPGPREEHQYDVAGDGQRFILVCPAEAGRSEPITVVLNWTADRKR